MHIGPISPLMFPSSPVIFAIDSDESSMLVPESMLSAEESALDKEYVDENIAYGLGFFAITREDDYFIIDDKYRSHMNILAWLADCYRNMGISCAKNIHFAKSKSFIETALRLSDGIANPIIATTCISYNLDEYISCEDVLEVSVKINEKRSFQGLATTYGLPTPFCYTDHIALVTYEILKSKFLNCKTIFAKKDGLGGGVNVFKIKNEYDFNVLQQSYPDQCFLFQEGIDALDKYEALSSWIMSDAGVKNVSNRIMLIHNQEWYGNLFIPGMLFSSDTIQCLEKGLVALSKQGYKGELGYILGFDGFADKEGGYQITEINGRYLGSTPTEQILAKLGLLNEVHAVGITDYVDIDDLEKYMQYIQSYLYSNDTKEGIIPLSLNPAYNERGKRGVSFVVVGNLQKRIDYTINSVGKSFFERFVVIKDMVQKFI